MTAQTLENFLHDFRKEIDKNIQTAENQLERKDLSGNYMRCMALARTKLQEAKMWAGKCLEAIGSELPKEFQDKYEPEEN